MKIARLYFEVLQKLYESLPEPPETRTALAIKHASAQEGLGPPTVPGLDHLADHFDHQGIVYKASNKFTYKNMAAQSLTRFKKLSKPSHISQTGTLQDLDKRKTSAAHSKSLQISRHQLQHLTLNNFDMDLWGQDFVFNEPETDPFSLRTEEGTTKDCSRCKKGFFVKPHLEPHEERECSHHWVCCCFVFA